MLPLREASRRAGLLAAPEAQEFRLKRDLDSAVERSAFLGGVIRDRLGASVRGSGDAGTWDAILDEELGRVDGARPRAPSWTESAWS